jgi:hypothetical protein
VDCVVEQLEKVMATRRLESHGEKALFLDLVIDIYSRYVE